jgi:hypothetical protein
VQQRLDAVRASRTTASPDESAGDVLGRLQDAGLEAGGSDGVSAVVAIIKATEVMIGK